MASRFRRLLRPLRKNMLPSNWGDPSIVVGLGNPGIEYRNTRHNVGWWCIDELGKRSQAKFKLRGHAHMAEVLLGKNAVVLVKPTTFVNESGRAVEYVLNRYNTSIDRLVVVLDEMDLTPGRLRIRGHGGSGGHNGLRSIIYSTGTEDFVRVRIGIGRPEFSGQEVEHVLSKLPPPELSAVRNTVMKSADAIESILDYGIESAANNFNS